MRLILEVWRYYAVDGGCHVYDGRSFGASHFDVDDLLMYMLAPTWHKGDFMAGTQYSREPVLWFNVLLTYCDVFSVDIQVYNCIGWWAMFDSIYVKLYIDWILCINTFGANLTIVHDIFCAFQM